MDHAKYAGDPRFVVVPPQIRIAFRALEYSQRIQQGAFSPDGAIQVIDGRKLSQAEDALYKSANQALIRYLNGEDYCVMTPPEVHNHLMLISPEQQARLLSDVQGGLPPPDDTSESIGAPLE